MKTTRARQSMSEINITPLVDVMLVLLVIFMVTAPAMKQGLEVSVPSTRAAGLSLSTKPFYLSIQKTGRVLIGDQAVSPQNLGPKLKSIFKTRKNKQVYIQADKKVLYEVVARVMAEVSAAGVSSIALVTQPSRR